MLSIRNNKDLLTLKVFGYSNLKIFFILAFTSFFLGWIILFFVNPITSSMSKYYEKTKSSYSINKINLNSNRLYAFTDGLSESLNKNGEEIGIDGSIKIIENNIF